MEQSQREATHEPGTSPAVGDGPVDAMLQATNNVASEMHRFRQEYGRQHTLLAEGIKVAGTALGVAAGIGIVYGVAALFTKRGPDLPSGAKK